MGFWAFADNSPYLAVLGLLIVAVCIVECVGHIAKACGGKGCSDSIGSKLDVKVTPKAAEKAH